MYVCRPQDVAKANDYDEEIIAFRSGFRDECAQHMRGGRATDTLVFKIHPTVIVRQSADNSMHKQSFFRDVGVGSGFPKGRRGVVGVLAEAKRARIKRLRQIERQKNK